MNSELEKFPLTSGRNHTFAKSTIWTKFWPFSALKSVFYCFLSILSPEKQITERSGPFHTLFRLPNALKRPSKICKFANLQRYELNNTDVDLQRFVRKSLSEAEVDFLRAVWLSRRSRITNRESVTSDLQRAWFPNIWCYDRSVMLFELDLRVRVLQVGTSALKPYHDIVLKDLKINSWERAHYEIGARVGESGGRTAKIR